MKRFFMVIGLVAIALGLLAVDVFGLGDRTVLTPPPEAVTEGFLREMTMKRYEPATAYLSSNLSRELPEARLEEIGRDLEARAGRISDVRAETLSMSGNYAEAVGLLKSDRAGELRFTIRLKWEEGQWAVDGLRGVVDGDDDRRGAAGPPEKPTRANTPLLSRVRAR